MQKYRGLAPQNIGFGSVLLQGLWLQRGPCFAIPTAEPPEP